MNSFHSAIQAFEEKHLIFKSKSAEEFSERYERFHGAYDAEIQETSKTNAVASLATARLDCMNIAVTRWNAGISGTVLSDHDHFCLRLPLAGTADTINPHCGTLTSGPNELGVFRAEQGVNTRTSTDNAALNLAIPTDLLASRAKSQFGTELAHPLHFSSSVKLNSPAGEAIKSLIALLLVQLVHAPDSLEDPLTNSTMNDLIVSALFSYVPHNYQSLSIHTNRQVIPCYVSRAEDFMRANAHNPITVSMLAEAAGCSERALQSAFKTFRNVSPLSALRDVRLDRVREDLCRGEESVTEIAFKWGFYNPGRLAGLYSQKFGENPSRTLRDHS